MSDPIEENDKEAELPAPPPEPPTRGMPLVIGGLPLGRGRASPEASSLQTPESDVPSDAKGVSSDALYPDSYKVHGADSLIASDFGGSSVGRIRVEGVSARALSEIGASPPGSIKVEGTRDPASADGGGSGEANVRAGLSSGVGPGNVIEGRDIFAGKAEADAGSGLHPTIVDQPNEQSPADRPAAQVSDLPEAPIQELPSGREAGTSNAKRDPSDNIRPPRP
jgi:hypothetical protein